MNIDDKCSIASAFIKKELTADMIAAKFSNFFIKVNMMVLELKLEIEI